MSDNSRIEWTDATWNFIVGCTKVSPGCDNCYAERDVNRWNGDGAFDTVVIKPEKLELPLHWRRPRRVFVNSLSDLFHEAVPDEIIARAFAVMEATPRHTYQILTKRHARMRALLSSSDFLALVDDARVALTPGCPDFVWPLLNVWLGVSVEDQKWADIRIPALLDTPAAVRFLSCEPLLGPVTLRGSWHDYLAGWRTESEHATHCDCAGAATTCPVPVQIQTGAVDWVIVGGESGPGARPMHADWVRQIRDDCAATGTAFFFKQWGQWRPLAGNECARSGDEWPAGTQGQMSRRCRSKHEAGRELDGRTHDDMPDRAAVPA